MNSAGDCVLCHWIRTAPPEERAKHPDAVALHSDPDHLAGCDSWRCTRCGNTGPDDGFVTCDSEGNEVDARAGAAFTFLFCGRCGELIDLDGFYVGRRRGPEATDRP